MTDNKSSKGSKVGIFMPCYNMGDYLDESLDSLYKQSFNDFTVIIADDASPAKSTVKKLSKISRPGCKIYYEKKNLGLIRISNKYMSKLDAEYIMLFSPDDKLHPDFLKVQVSYLDANPDVHAVCTWIQEFGDGHDLIEYNDDLCGLPYMLVKNHFSGAALIRKTAWLAAGKYDTNKDFYPNLDYELWMSMLEKGFKLRTIPKPYFYWRVVRSSLSHRMGPKQILIFHKALLEKYSTMYRKHYDFVINHNLEIISKFEEYYSMSEEGHDWLDKQYKNLTREVERLSEENSSLVARLNHSIQRPYIRSIAGKTKRYMKRHS